MCWRRQAYTPIRHYIDKRRATVTKTIQGQLILLECMGAKRQEGIPHRFNWWQQTLDYTGEEEGEEVGLMRSLNSSALLARSPITPPPPPAHRTPAPLPAWRLRSPVELLDTTEQEALDAL